MISKKGRILSGIKPSGKVHLGNYLGALSNWVKLQEEYDAFYMIADLHALTTAYEDTSNIAEDKKDLMLDLLAIGLDPKKCTLFVQSEVPEHAELHLILSMVTPLPWLERVPTYKALKEEMKGHDLNTYGFLGYPVLQAADILVYNADIVPVGKDQLPHVELTREIARRFNNFFGHVFNEPKDKLTEFPILPGLDGRKMSKSYNNTINISDESEVITKKVMTMFTDPTRIKRTDKGHPEKCPVHAYHKIFNRPERVLQIAQDCKAAKIGCVDCKKELAVKINDALKEIHSKRKELSKDFKSVKKVFTEGAEKARAVT
ncbi:MAG: tryptophan--tRNA ligase, partial [Candidatus Margulisbacteria bacterium]|nr:tryptophan--tRNA ligase [Candidatus Margulisiibacteriota bacterium]